MRRAALIACSSSSACLAGGCGLGAGESEEGGATITVTRDFGTRDVGAGTADPIPGGETVMRMLQRGFEVETRYGGGFVQQINGIAGGREDGRPVDWFYYVNGILADDGATAAHKLAPGDDIWWDHHDWSGSADVRAVVGAFPEPFESGIDGKRLPVRLDCADAAADACDEVAERLERGGRQGRALGRGELRRRERAARQGRHLGRPAQGSGGAAARGGAEGVRRLRAAERGGRPARAARSRGRDGAHGRPRQRARRRHRARRRGADLDRDGDGRGRARGGSGAARGGLPERALRDRRRARPPDGVCRCSRRRRRRRDLRAPREPAARDARRRRLGLVRGRGGRRAVVRAPARVVRPAGHRRRRRRRCARRRTRPARAGARVPVRRRDRADKSARRARRADRDRPLRHGAGARAARRHGRGDRIRRRARAARAGRDRLLRAAFRRGRPRRPAARVPARLVPLGADGGACDAHGAGARA